MKEVNVGGVPEHFNLPWHFALENGLFQKRGIKLVWKDYPGGTGAMCQALRKKELDVAVVLTEGIVADISKGNDCKLVQWFVRSPLIWGIHVAHHSPIQSMDQINNKKYAISRLGSGSHLMAHVDAHQRGLKIQDEQFVVVQNILGAEKALISGEADLFLWEKWMTKPYVDQGIFRRIGECPTPWPSFAIAVRTDFLKGNGELIQNMLAVIHQSCNDFKQLPDCIERIVFKFKLQPEDVATWMEHVQWQTEKEFNKAPLGFVVEKLIDLDLIDPHFSVSSLYDL